MRVLSACILMQLSSRIFRRRQPADKNPSFCKTDTDFTVYSLKKHMTATELNPRELIPTRHSLITRLKDWEDQEGWKEFFDTYSELIFNVARKAGLTESEAHEVVQETVITVAKSLKDFKTGSEHGSFKAWLLKTTRWRIADQFRKRPPEQENAIHHAPDDTARTGTLERVPDPNSLQIEAAWDKEWEEHRMAIALQRLKRKVSAKQFQIFQMLTAQGLHPTQVAKILGISKTLVYVTKHRLAKQFKKELDRVAQEIH